MKQWELNIAAARRLLADFIAKERDWFNSIGDPRLYVSRHQSAFDAYVARFPRVPDHLLVTMQRALNQAALAFDALAQELVGESLSSAHTYPVVFPFAPNEGVFLQPSNVLYRTLFRKAVQDAFVDVAPYEGGDDLLYAVHCLGHRSSPSALAPHAQLSDPLGVTIGTLSFAKGADQKHIHYHVDSSLAAPHTDEKVWDPVRNELLIARWKRRRRVHVQAKIRSWIAFPDADDVPKAARAQPASAFATRLIDRAENMISDWYQNLCMADAPGSPMPDVHGR